MHRPNLRAKKTSVTCESLEERRLFALAAMSFFKSYPIGKYSDSVITADLNHDGHADIVVANFGESSLSILLGRGNGTFDPAVSVPVGNGPTQVVAGDLNGDGNVDLVVADSGLAPFDKTNTFENCVSVLLGNGDGTFQTQQTYPTGKSPQGVVLADFNSDSHLDIATANGTDGTVSILLNTGAGTLTNSSTIPIGTQTESLGTGDFNKDGKADIVATNYASGSIYVQLGNGDGTFTPWQFIGGAGLPRTTIVADVNNDGYEDIITTSSAKGFFSVFTNKGNGSFNPLKAYVGGAVPFAATVADINNDNRPDVLTVDEYNNNFGVSLGRVDNFLQNRIGLGTLNTASGVACADFNEDGKNDAVVISFNSNKLSIFLNALHKTQTELVASQSSSPIGSFVQFTARVTSPAGLVRTQVAFFDNGKFITSRGIGTDDQARLIIRNLAVGTHVITAEPVSTNYFASSVSPAVLYSVVDTPPAVLQTVIHVVIANTKSALPDSPANTQLTIQNQGEGLLSGVVNIKLFFSTDSTLSNDDIAVTAPAFEGLRLNLNTRQYVTIGTAFHLPTVPTPGKYYLIAEIIPVSGITAADLSPLPGVSAYGIAINA